MTPALIAALVLAATPAAASASSKPHAHKPVVVEPKWESFPNGDDFADLYPAAAAGALVEGDVKLHCKVHLDGGLFDCTPVTETPEGWGFGQASLALVPHFKMHPRLVDGAPVDGAPVEFTIRWRKPELDASAEAPTLAQAEARDPEALGLARQVAGKLDGFDTIILLIRHAFGSRILPLFGQTDPARTTAIGATFLDSFNDLMAERRDRQAASLVFHFSREELKALKDFLETPAGAAFALKYPSALLASYGQSNKLWISFVEAWQTRYCAKVACDDRDFSAFRKLHDGSWAGEAIFPAVPAAPEPAKDGKGG